MMELDHGLADGDPTAPRAHDVVDYLVLGPLDVELEQVEARVPQSRHRGLETPYRDFDGIDQAPRPVHDARRDLSGVFRRMERHHAIGRGQSAFVEAEPLDQPLPSDPCDRLWSRVEAAHGASERPNQGQIEAHVLANADRIHDARGAQSIRTDRGAAVGGPDAAS